MAVHWLGSLDLGVELRPPLKGEGLPWTLAPMLGEDSGLSRNSPSMLARGDALSVLPSGCLKPKSFFMFWVIDLLLADPRFKPLDSLLITTGLGERLVVLAAGWLTTEWLSSPSSLFPLSGWSRTCSTFAFCSGSSPYSTHSMNQELGQVGMYTTGWTHCVLYAHTVGMYSKTCL
jgi:hypothetical protein